MNWSDPAVITAWIGAFAAGGAAVAGAIKFCVWLMDRRRKRRLAIASSDAPKGSAPNPVQQLKAGPASVNIQAARDLIYYSGQPSPSPDSASIIDRSLSVEAKTLLLVALIKGGEIVRTVERGLGEAISVGKSPTRVGFSETEEVRVAFLNAFDTLLEREQLRPQAGPFFTLSSSGRGFAGSLKDQIQSLSPEAKTLLLAGARAWRAGDDPHFKVGPPGVRGVSAGSAGEFGRQDPIHGPRYEDALAELERLELARQRSSSAHCLTAAGADLAAVLEAVRRVCSEEFS